MKKRGFTLVELMGVLVILGVLLIFTVPSITNTLKTSESNELKEYEKTVCMAAKSYMELNKINTPRDINLKVLRDEGYLSKNLTNPKTGEKDSRIYVTFKNNKMVCGEIY